MLQNTFQAVQTLSPAAQVAGIVMVGIIIVVIVLALFTDFFDNISFGRGDGE